MERENHCFRKGRLKITPQLEDILANMHMSFHETDELNVMSIGNLILLRSSQLKTWGFRGAINYLRHSIQAWLIKRHFRKNAKQHSITPSSGITLVADMTGTGSLSKTTRDLAFKLRDAGIPFQTFDLHKGPILIPKEDYQDILTPTAEFQSLRFSHVIEMCTNLFPQDLPVKHSRIYFWEFDSGLTEYDASLSSPGEVVTMSDFNHEVFRQCLPTETTVRKILYPFVFDIKDIAPVTEIRKKYDVPSDAFIVFFNFDFGTSYRRKNPEDALRAFANAFANESKAYFLFKTKNTSHYPNELAALKVLARRLRVDSRIRIISDYLSMRELYGLTNACDVYISLHRGEGFGLGIAEAMSMGKPVVVTDYSATTEFCNASNSIPIPFTMTDVKPGDIDNPCYRAVRRWAQPDITAASTALRSLFDNPAQCAILGVSAKRFITNYFSTENFKDSIIEFLSN